MPMASVVCGVALHSSCGKQISFGDYTAATEKSMKGSSRLPHGVGVAVWPASMLALSARAARLGSALHCRSYPGAVQYNFLLTKAQVWQL